MARKTVRIDQLPAAVRAELEATQATEEAKKRLFKLLTGNHRLLDAAVACFQPEGDGDPARPAVLIFEEVVVRAAQRGQVPEAGGA